MTKTQIKSDGGSTAYYDLPEGATQLGDLIEHKAMNFNVGTIFKAAYRLGEKAGFDAAYDLKKIVWSAQRELARVERATPPPCKYCGKAPCADDCIPF